jgi:hypothetical protein
MRRTREVIEEQDRQKTKAIDAAERRWTRVISQFMIDHGHRRFEVAWQAQPGSDPQLVEVRGTDGKRVSRLQWLGLGALGVPILDWAAAKREVWPFLDAQHKVAEACERYITSHGWTNRSKAAGFLATMLLSTMGVRAGELLKLVAAVRAWKRIDADTRRGFIVAVETALAEARPRVNLDVVGPAALGMLRWVLEKD